MSLAHAAEPMVATGYQFTVYLAVDGTVWTWGKNSFGQLGQGDTTDRNTPVMVPGLNNVIGVSAGYYHCLAVKADGTVWAWGRNANGELGQGSTSTSINSPVIVPNLGNVGSPGAPAINNSSITMVAAGGLHSMALAAGNGGALYAWGYNGFGEVGNGTTTSPVTNPYRIGYGYRSAAAGTYHSLTIDSTGQALGWGNNTEGQIGDGTMINKSTPTPVSGGTNALSIACGNSHSMMVKSNALAYAWGRNDEGQVGNNVPGPDVSTPYSLGYNTSRVIASGNNSMLVAPWGYVYVWGNNATGQCRQAITTTQYNTPLAIGYLFPQQRALFGGFGSHSALVLDNGLVQTWGNNDSGQLGYGVTGSSGPTVQTPIANWSLEGMIAIDAGNAHSIALKADGTVWTSGADSSGQLGDDAALVNKSTPVQVVGFSHGIVAIAAGSYHNLALDSNGLVWVWGSDTNGQLGDDAALVNKAVPVQLTSNYCRAIGAGGYHSLAVTYNGSVISWGAGSSGQLGNGLVANQPTAVGVSSLTDVWQITGGWSHSLALKADGSVWSWGLDNAGQLGDDAALANKAVPVLVSGTSSDIAIAAGQYHSLSVRTYTTHNSWGGDAGGQLGDSVPLTNQPTPAIISTIDSIKQMSAGGDFGDLSIALTTDGLAYTFGRDNSGGLGDNAALVDQPTPVLVAGLANLVAVAAGDYHCLALRADGTVVSWGLDSSGQLGNDASLVNQTAPVPVYSAWLPTVSYNAGSSVSNATEPGGIGNQGTITFTRTGPLTASLPLSYSLSGSAVNGGDFTPLSGSATIPSGSASVTIIVNPFDDLIAENAETVTLTLNGSPMYLVGAPAGGSVTISDNDVASVAVSPVSGLITTEAGGTASFNVHLTSRPMGASDVTINFVSSNSAEGTILPASLTFKPTGASAWNIDQTITITGVNDNVQDGNIGYQINNGGAVSPSDPFYNGKPVSSVAVSNTDNDTAGYTVSLISAHTTEAGGTATFTIRLNSQPTANVTIGLTSDNIAEGTVSLSSVTFTPVTGIAGGWNLNQTVTVTGVNDAIADGNITYNIVTGAASTTDLNYGPLAVPDIIVVNDDNDVVGVAIVESGANTALVEGGATDTYTVRLTSQPTQNVSIVINPGTQCTNDQPLNTLTFTAGNWNSLQTVTVTAIDDLVAEGPHAGVLTHSSTSLDLKYNGGSVPFTVNGLAGNTITASIADNDSAGYTIVQTGGSTDVTEAGGTDTYTIRLNTQPTGTVVVTLSGDAQVNASGPLSFTTATGAAGGWDQPQSVAVSAINDNLVEGPHTGVITGSASGGGYGGIAVPTVSVNVTDNDVGSVVVVETVVGTPISESGTTNTYTVVLGAQPGGTVTIAVNPDGQAQVSKDGSTFFATVNLSFTTSTWNAPQTVTIKAVNDAVAEGAHLSTISHSASGSGYNGVSINKVDANITDNDFAGVTVSALGGVITEAVGPTHSTTYSVVLNSQPTNSVSITVSPNSQVTVSAGTLPLVFTPGTWNVAQTVTVTAVDDTVYEGAHTGTVTHNASSSDPKYNGIAILNAVPTVTDNDNQPTVAFAVGVSNGAESVTSGNLAVKLTFSGGTTATAVNATLTYSAASGTATVGGVDASVTSGSLVFTPGQTSKTIPFTVVNDSIDEANENFSVTLATPVNCALGTAVHTYTINDDDTAGIIIVETSGGTTVAEGGASDTYTVVLTSEPTADVTVNITGMTAQGVTVSSAALLFTYPVGLTPWNVPQTVTVTAVNDGSTEGTLTESLHHVASSADLVYAGMAGADVTATIIDNDIAGVTVTGLSAATVTEGLVSDSYTVRLNTDPTTGTVSINASADGQLRVSLDNATFSPSVSLTFTSGGLGNWATPRTVYVKAFDDLIVEGNHLGTIVHNSVHTGGATYSGLAIVNITANIVDNDVPSVVVTQSTGTTAVTEGGATDTYAVVLAVQPNAGVVVSVTPDTQVSASPSSLLFTTGNWNIPQTVTVTAVDDAVAESAPQTATITHAAVGGGYAGVSIASVVATITDNDVPAVIINQSAGSTVVDESGTTDTYTVALATKPQPGTTVTVDLASDGFVTISSNSVVFTPADYNVPQTITVNAVNDLVAQGAHTGTVTHAIGTGGTPDPKYTGVVIPSVIATIADNDSAGLVVTQSAGTTTVTEGGTTDTFQVQLTSQPSSPVTVTLAPDSKVGVSAATLTFTLTGATAWNLPQVVTVTAIDNLIAEGPHNGTISISSSNGAEYNALTTSVTATITDNDTAGVTVNIGTGVAVDETSGSGSYTVRLNTIPTAPVIISISPNAQVNVATSALFFTAATWNLPQAVTVTAVDDQVAEGPHTGFISHVALSGDPIYQGISINSVSPTITDNDSAAIVVSQTSGVITSESGGTGSFTMRLSSKPLVPVLIGLSSSNVLEGTVSPTSLTFTTLNWSTPQTVTATGVPDSIADGNQIYSVVMAAASAASDVNYNGLYPSDVSVINLDINTAGILISGNTVVTEDSSSNTATYTVKLSSKPNVGSVVVTLSTDGQTSVSPLTLTYDQATWNQTQMVTVTGIDDGIDEASLHTGVINHNASGGGYTGISATSTVSITDNPLNASGIVVSAMSGITKENGQTGTFTVKLSSKPVANVTIILASSNTAEGTVSPTSLTFTPSTGAVGGWNQLQTVTVTGVDDRVDDGDVAYSIQLTAVSGDTNYNVGHTGMSDVAAVNQDDDMAGVTISTASFTTTEAEGAGHQSTFVVSVDTQPTANVTIAMNGVDPKEGTISPSSLVFTPINWTVPQTVTVTGVDDSIDDGAGNYTITPVASSTDLKYNLLAGISPVDVSNVDDDTAGITVTPIAGLITSEYGGTATFTVRLDTEPTANVVIALSSNSPEGVITPASVVSLTFTNLNWDTPQSVTVTGVDDLLPDGAIPYDIVTGLAVSTDLKYNGINPPDVSLTNDPHINVAPVLVLNAPVTLASTIAEDTAAGTGWVTVSSILGLLSTSDADTGTAVPGIAVVDVDASGIWEYSIDGGASSAGVLTMSSDLSALLLSNAAVNRIRFTPGLNFAGTASLSLRLWDETTGTDTALANVSVNGGTTAFSLLTVAVQVVVTPVNDAPTVDLNGVGLGINAAASYPENSGPVQVLSSAVVTDIDNAQLSGMTITLGVVDVGAETLAVDVTGTSIAVVSTLVGANRILTLSGPDSVAAYQQVVRSLTYDNISNNPTVVPLALRSITVVGTDGTSSSIPATLTTTIQALNDPPNLTTNGFSLSLGQTVILSTFAPVVLIGDDVETSDPMQLTFVLDLVPGQGQLRKSGVALAISDTFTLADFQAGLITYKHTAAVGGTDGFAVRLTDPGLASSPLRTVIVTIFGASPPVVLLSGGPLTIGEEAPATLLDTGVTTGVTDPDSSFLNGGSLTVTLAGAGVGDILSVSGVASGPVSIGGIVIGAVAGGTGGSPLVVTFTSSSTATPARVTALLQNIQYRNVSDTPPAGARVLTVVVNDGGISSIPVTTTITVTPYDDAPRFTLTQTFVTVPGISRPGQVVAVDPEGLPLTFTIESSPTQGSLTLNAATGAFVYTAVDNPAATDSFTMGAFDGVTKTTQVYAVVISLLGQPQPIIISPAPMIIYGADTLLYTPVVTTPAVSAVPPVWLSSSLTYQLLGTLPGAAFNPANGSINWPTPAAPPGTSGYYQAAILVIDQANERAFYQPLLFLWIAGGGPG